MARDMSIAVYDYPQMVAQICKTASEHNVMEVNEAIPYTNKANKLRKDTSHKILVTCREGSINMFFKFVVFVCPKASLDFCSRQDESRRDHGPESSTYGTGSLMCWLLIVHMHPLPMSGCWRPYASVLVIDCAYASFTNVRMLAGLAHLDCDESHGVCVLFNLQKVEGWQRATTGRLSNLHRSTPVMDDYQKPLNPDGFNSCNDGKLLVPYEYEIDNNTMSISKKGKLGFGDVLCHSSGIHVVRDVKAGIVRTLGGQPIMVAAMAYVPCFLGYQTLAVIDNGHGMGHVSTVDNIVYLCNYSSVLVIDCAYMLAGLAHLDCDGSVVFLMNELPCSTQYFEANNLPRSEFIDALLLEFIEIAVVVKL
nr:phospholipase-like protein [Tanacetum cinerariifolium]